MNKSDFGKLALDLLDNKAEALDQLLRDYESLGKNQAAMDKLIELIDSGQEVSQNKVNSRLAKVINHQSKVMQRMNLILTIYLQSEDSEGALGSLANKCGLGEEALRKMFGNKFKGKF